MGLWYFHQHKGLSAYIPKSYASKPVCDHSNLSYDSFKRPSGGCSPDPWARAAICVRQVAVSWSPAIRHASRSWLRSSSNYEPSDPPSRILIKCETTLSRSFSFNIQIEGFQHIQKDDDLAVQTTTQCHQWTTHKHPFKTPSHQEKTWYRTKLERNGIIPAYLHNHSGPSNPVEFLQGSTRNTWRAHLLLPNLGVSDLLLLYVSSELRV